MIKISAIIIARNEEEKISDCLKSVVWVSEIIVVDNGSIDRTVSIAKKFGAKVIRFPDVGFSKLRNEGVKKAKGEWVFYIDADERVTPELQKEIQSTINNQQSTVSNEVAFAIPRKNIILGREMKHGGWWPDYVKRLFLKSGLKKWQGRLHEEPVFEGELGHLENSLTHLKHNKLEEMVEKTNEWSEIEAKLLFKSGHPEMSWWRFLRIMLTELWLRLVIQRGFMDGPEGVIYSLYQMWSKFITYAKLWELQLGNSKFKVQSSKLKLKV